MLLGVRCSSFEANCCNADVVKGSGCFLKTFLGVATLHKNLKSLHFDKKSVTNSSVSNCLFNSNDKFRFVKIPVVLYTNLPGDFFISK